MVHNSNMKLRNKECNVVCYKDHKFSIKWKHYSFRIWFSKNKIQIALHGDSIVSTSGVFEISDSLFHGTFSYFMGLMSAEIYADMLENELEGELITKVAKYLRNWNK